MATLGKGFIAGYRLTKLLHNGQTTQVWEAVRQGDPPRVVFKAIPPAAAQDRANVNELKYEFRVVSSLRHPNVIRALQLGEDGGVHFMMMEFFAAESLKAAIRDRFDDLVYDVPQIIEQAAEGLCFVNLQGWVHRDIKPDNYLLNQEARVKLIDFSIAQKKGGLLSRLFTKAPSAAGTKSYIAPEQIKGGHVDERADVYGFGCMVFELISGKLPYTASSANALLNKHLKAPVPSLRTACDNVTPEFSDLVGRTMAKRTEDRPKSMYEFLKDFRTMRVFHTQPRRMTEP